VRPDLSYVEALALHAGEILRRGIDQDFQISYKGTIDLVTEMDHHSEDYLLGEIRRDFPGHRIVSEEVGLIEGDNDHAWYLDPLDGTVNYAHRIPLYTVSVAYTEHNRVILGAVYDPSRNELFMAECGKGARLNGKPISASKVQSLDQCLLTTGFPYDIRVNPETNLENYQRFSLCTRGVRRFGSAALDMAYVACGRVDGFWELRLKDYDIAAGALIAKEAGATVTTLEGDSNYLTPTCSIVAAAPGIHSELLRLLRQKN
jgi:myo-inositol-1(or 4)-monophosphatase